MKFIWIILYIVMLANLQKIYLAAGLLLYCVLLLVYLYKKGKFHVYGLCKIKSSVQVLVFLVAPFASVIIANICSIDLECLYHMTIDELIVMICVAFVEEFFFRGWMFVKFSGYGSVIITNILFAVSHMLNLGNGAEIKYTVCQVLWAFCMGVSFSLITKRLKSLLPAIVIHALINISSLGISNMIFGNYVVVSVMAILCMIYELILYYIFITKEKKNL